MKALDVIEEIITDQNLENCIFELILHSAEINWRQKYPDFQQKITNVSSGILFDKHDPIRIAGKDILNHSIIERFSTSQRPLLSISSRFTDSYGRVRHIPMMNLHLDFPISLIEIEEVISRISPEKHYLLTTDRYYHVYGTKILDNQAEWQEWNLKFLMIDTIVSPRYIGHSLERGFNLLRINSTDIVKKLTPKLVTGSTSQLQDVRLYAIVKHGYQRRKSGEMYFVHLLDVEKVVSEIILELNLHIDQELRIDLLSAALLHDTIEDTYTDFEDIEELCNERVAILVSRLSNDKRLPSQKRAEEYINKLIESDIFVHIIKLADIYSNLTGIRGNEGEKWIKIFALKSSTYLNILKQNISGTKHFKKCEELIAKYLDNGKD